MYVDPNGEFVWFAPIIWAADLIKIFSENTNYYIIDKVQDSVNGPLNRNAFFKFTNRVNINFRSKTVRILFAIIRSYIDTMRKNGISIWMP